MWKVKYKLKSNVSYDTKPVGYRRNDNKLVYHAWWTTEQVNHARLDERKGGREFNKFIADFCEHDAPTIARNGARPTAVSHLVAHPNIPTYTFLEAFSKSKR